MNFTARLQAASVITLVATGLAVPTPAAGALAPIRPPALPESGSGPAAFAYLCANPKDPEKLPTGPCDTWRLVTTHGKIFTVPEAVAWEKSKDPNEGGEPGSFAISPDGTRVAYHRARDRRIVVRELTSGKIWTIPYQVPTGLGSPFGLRFVRDGRQLTIFAGDSGVDTLVQVEAGTVQRLPKGWRLLDADPATGRLTLLDQPVMQVRGAFLTVEGERKTTAKIAEKAGKHLIWGAFAARNGRAANLVPKEPPACGPDMTPVWLAVFSTRTGKMTTVKPRLRADVYRADVIDWLNAKEIVVAAGRERPGKTPDTVVGSYVYAMNVTTGATRLIAKLSTTEEVYQDSLEVGGYTAAQDRPAAGKVAKPRKRGCD
ncbi:hypothetical protein ACIHFD_10865 [Nonomuraea sp. NPDC051941]|uniref:hypothetical protein n=1 Tax=Nonomuraea sp. NPDC051941 TaxID=3364373 RepID=UPI0037C7E3DE